MTDGEYPQLDWEGTGAAPIPAPESVPLSGSGTEVDPYHVGSADELAILSWHVAVLDKHILLTADVDCASETLYPIGDLGPFSGVFNGTGHVVRNVSIDQPVSDRIGLFLSSHLLILPEMFCPAICDLTRHRRPDRGLGLHHPLPAGRGCSVLVV